MKPFKLEAKHMIPINETAFQKDAATRAMRSMIKQPEAIINAMVNTSLRFSLIPQQRHAIRLV